jgi:L-aminopeptidase/D-esterase-like protein
MKTGPLNLITDVAGLHVGNAEDSRLRSGVTAVLFEQAAVAAVDVRGGGPGTRETDLLAPENTVEAIDALVLSGGSAFGLDAAAGVQARLRGQGRGFAIGPARVPIVPAATMFDLLNGGNKDWGAFAPYRELGVAAVDAARLDFQIGGSGAGLGATTADLRGRLGRQGADAARGRWHAQTLKQVVERLAAPPLIGQGRVSVASSVLCLQQDRQNYPQAKRFRSHPAPLPA